MPPALFWCTLHLVDKCHVCLRPVFTFRLLIAEVEEPALYYKQILSLQAIFNNKSKENAMYQGKTFFQ